MNFEVGKNFNFEIHLQIAISLSIFDEFQQMRAQHFKKLDHIELKNSYIQLVGFHSFEKRIHCIFFRRHPVYLLDPKKSF